MAMAVATKARTVPAYFSGMSMVDSGEGVGVLLGDLRGGFCFKERSFNEYACLASHAKMSTMVPG